jgi:hypothetical protein
MNVEIEPIGRILRGIDGSDEYVLLRSNDDVFTHDLEAWLLDRYHTRSKGPGSYFCTSVRVIPHAHVGKYIGIIYHRYDV